MFYQLYCLFSNPSFKPKDQEKMSAICVGHHKISWWRVMACNVEWRFCSAFVCGVCNSRLVTVCRVSVTCRMEVRSCCSSSLAGPGSVLMAKEPRVLQYRRTSGAEVSRRISLHTRTDRESCTLAPWNRKRREHAQPQTCNTTLSVWMKLMAVVMKVCVLEFERWSGWALRRARQRYWRRSRRAETWLERWITSAWWGWSSPLHTPDESWGTNNVQ